MIININSPVLTRSLYAFRQSLSDESNLTLYQPSTDSSNTRLHNISLLSIVKKL